MRTEEFNYELPQELIAQSPIEPRDISRLMVINRETGKIEHKVFKDIAEYLGNNDCIVVNDTKVVPARLIGEKYRTGGKVEIFLLAQIKDNIWEALVKPGRRLKPGTRVVIANGEIMATIEKRLPGGERVVSLSSDHDIDEVIEEVGEVPLPPYITKPLSVGDRERYQTVYAREKGSVAAPTAGLHFTPQLLTDVINKNISIASVTLRVGLDTFRPVREEFVKNHKMHSELYNVTEYNTGIINNTINKRGKVIAVGTTSVRVLEATGTKGTVVPGTGETDIFIYPGFKFKITDAIITNFHLPKSTLFMMISAFGGTDLIMRAYDEAIKNKYRFYSFGDAMLIR